MTTSSIRYIDRYVLRSHFQVYEAINVPVYYCTYIESQRLLPFVVNWCNQATSLLIGIAILYTGQLRNNPFYSSSYALANFMIIPLDKEYS